MSINVPTFIILSKKSNILFITNYSNLTPILEKKKEGFFLYLKNFLITFQIPTKKTLVLRGLGLKAILKDCTLSLKLGYSHENIISINSSDMNTIFLGKKSISILNYNKLLIGNFSEKICRLKKANCYKGRGLYLKEKNLITKVIKKT